MDEINPKTKPIYLPQSLRPSIINLQSFKQHKNYNRKSCNNRTGISNIPAEIINYYDQHTNHCSETYAADNR